MRYTNIVDLFAGSGSMGLATLSSPMLARNGRIVWAAESNSRFAGVIQRNYRTYSAIHGAKDRVPASVAPIDLLKRQAFDYARQIKRKFGCIDILVAGPPCQGFSLANRLSRSSSNPLNALSLIVLKYVSVLKPLAVILENVPGIRTMTIRAGSSITTMDVLQEDLKALGYSSEVLMLNALDFGVPQSRLRSFLVAIRGSVKSPEFVVQPTHGPGRPEPYVTVEEAIGDLPSVANGSCAFEVKYASKPVSAFQTKMREFSSEKVTDHITSNHSSRVLERYALVPEGGNWTAIRHLLQETYSNPERTHLNIYHRLRRDRPARTIGHFRKAMTIHPWENRGLSLREAARLQSMPDWFAFADPAEPIRRGVVAGLHAYQQQIGNAVCFLQTTALATRVARSLAVA